MTEYPTLPIEGACEHKTCSREALVRIELTDIELVVDSCIKHAGKAWVVDPDWVELKGYKE